MRRVAVIVLAVLAAACAPAAAAPRFVGFHDNAVIAGQLTPAADAALAASTGANSSGFMFDWRYAERGPGVWSLGTYDAIYRADLAAGIRPLIEIMYAPSWAWAEGTDCDPGTQSCRFAPAPEHLDA